MLLKHDIALEEPQIAEALRAWSQSRQCADRYDRRTAWSTSGPGPVALTGGQWASGVLLMPPEPIVHPSRVAALDWQWDRAKLGEWEGHINVRLLILDPETCAAWTLDVTNSEKSVVIVPAETKLSANCAITLQIKAGERVGKLYSPPFVRSASLKVTYRYFVSKDTHSPLLDFVGRPDAGRFPPNLRNTSPECMKFPRC